MFDRNVSLEVLVM
jgi:hypothetical protein